MNDHILTLTIFVFFTQIVFIYLRTLNVIYTTEGKKHKTAFSGMIMSLIWLASTAIGLNSAIEAITSFLNGDTYDLMLIFPLIGYVIGGGIGVYIAMYQKEYRDRKINERKERGDK
jgi:uncharacterized protein YebE (UPF0316 family)